MDSEISRSQFQQWKDQRRRADQAYYYAAEPIMDDDSYDALVSRIRVHAPFFGECEEDSSVMVLERPENATPHPSRMWSIDSVSLDNLAVLQTLFDTEDPVPAIVEPKLDGVAVNLVYQDGKLVDALLRGDYFQGESVFGIMRYIDNIPKNIDAQGLNEIRGELMLLKPDFALANQLRERRDLPPLSNPRNAVAGALRSLDVSVFTERKLTFYAYDVGLTTAELHSQTAVREWLFERDFDIPTLRHWNAVTNVEEIRDIFNHVRQSRGSLAFELDGIVIKANPFTSRWRLGEGHKTPNWAYALKFNESRAVTEVEAVYFTVGRTGVVTPVVEYHPVLLAGAQCRRATLHSMKQLQTLGVTVGDKIEVTRSGDTIPYVIRSLSPKPVTPPTRCPSCHALLVTQGIETLACPNQWNCPAQFEEVLVYQVSRAALDVTGISESTIREMLKTGEFPDIVSFWSLPEDLDRLYRVMNKARWGAPKMRRVYSAIKSARHARLDKILIAAGIPDWGEVTCKKLAKRFGTLKEILKAIDNQSIASHLHDHAFKSLQASGANVAFLEYANRVFSIEPVAMNDGPWKDMTFALTGTLASLSRPTAKKAIEERGGTASSSITKDTSVVIVGENAGAKLKTAQKKGLTIWDETQFLEQLNKD